MVEITHMRKFLKLMVADVQDEVFLAVILILVLFLFFSVADMLSASGKTSGKLSSNFKLVDRLKSTGPNPSLVRGSSHLISSQ